MTMEDIKKNYLLSIRKQCEYNKLLGEKTFDQLSDKEIAWQYNSDSNSIATIVKHLSGNMLSRWSNFLTSDGEKEWRNRDDEFEQNIQNKTELLFIWEKGWKCLFQAIDSIDMENFDTIVYIRNMGHTVVEASHRQLAHYSYHIGQIVCIGKMCKGKHWNSLSIPKGQSKTYNKSKFSKTKRREHFTDDLS